MIGDLLFTLICMAYFAGGIAIGWYSKGWRNSKHNKGEGRWD